MADMSKVDWSKVNIKYTYVEMTPEQTAYYKQQAELEDQDKEPTRTSAAKRHEHNMRHGSAPRIAINEMRLERTRQRLNDAEMMARSGLDAAALASMTGSDANPTTRTLEVYARALGKKLLIVLVEDEDEAAS
jgi:hypothetical protein